VSFEGVLCTYSSLIYWLEAATSCLSTFVLPHQAKELTSSTGHDEPTPPGTRHSGPASLDSLGLPGSIGMVDVGLPGQPDLAGGWGAVGHPPVPQLLVQYRMGEGGTGQAIKE